MSDPTIWYAVMTAPRREADADRNLRRQGYYTFYPFQRIRKRIKVPNRNQYRVEWRETPYFPRYIFVGIRPARGENLMAVNETDGVSTVVYLGRDAVPIPDEVIDALMAVGDGSGLIAAEDMTRLSRNFFGKVGQQFRVGVGSPFAGLMGTIYSISALDRTGAVKAWVSAFGGKVKVDVPADLVELAS